MSLPESVMSIAIAAVKRHGDDITAAVDEAETKIRKLKEFSEVVDALVHDAVQRLVYQLRGQSNQAVRRQSGVYGQPAKVRVGASESVAVAEASYLSYYIGGRTLGGILGSELLSIAESETAVAAGHQFNAELCRQLAAIVPQNKSVAEVVSERRLRNLFKKLRGSPLVEVA